eukprot:4923530-Amphidinium_carterae.1
MVVQTWHGCSNLAYIWNRLLERCPSPGKTTSCSMVQHSHPTASGSRETSYSFGQQMPILPHLAAKTEAACCNPKVVRATLLEVLSEAHAQVSMTEEIQSSLKTPTTLTETTKSRPNSPRE